MSKRSPRKSLPQTAKPRAKPPPFQLSTDRRAQERMGPVQTTSILDDGPEVMLPDDFDNQHPEMKFHCLIRPDTVLDIDSMERARQAERRAALADDTGLELETLLAEEDDPDLSEQLAQAEKHQRENPTPEPTVLRYPREPGTTRSSVRPKGNTYIRTSAPPKAQPSTLYSPPLALRSPQKNSQSHHATNFTSPVHHTALSKPSAQFSPSRVESPNKPQNARNTHPTVHWQETPYQHHTPQQSAIHPAHPAFVNALGQGSLHSPLPNAPPHGPAKYRAVGVPIGATPQDQWPGITTQKLISSEEKSPSRPHDSSLPSSTHPNHPPSPRKFPGLDFSTSATTVLDPAERRFRSHERREVFQGVGGAAQEGNFPRWEDGVWRSHSPVKAQTFVRSPRM